MNLTKFTETAKKLGVLGYKISQNGKLLHEWLAEPEIPRNVYSVTKSFVSCATGFAIQEGLISLDEKITEAFKNDLPNEISPNLAKATVEDLLTMRLGHRDGTFFEERHFDYTETDWVKKALAIPVEFEPKTHFVYSNASPYLLGVLIQRRANCTLTDYLMPRLFTPLGIDRPEWEFDPMGYNFGSSGLCLTLSALHKFGQFYLNKGEWNGKQLLNQQWIEKSTAKLYDDPAYGYLFWRGEYNSYRADGKYLQLVIVFPDYNAVATIVSHCENGDALFKAIWEEIGAQL